MPFVAPKPIESAASAGLLRRLGFTSEGVLRERWINQGESMDAEVYGLLRHEWNHREDHD